MSSSQSSPQADEIAAHSIGWASGIRLGLYYTLFFSLVFLGVFAVAYYAFAPVIHERELNIVRNRAAEYRAWFSTGDIEMLDARMNEQSVESGDVMFVRIVGPGLNYIQFIAPGGGQLPTKELADLDTSTEGVGIELGGDRWAIASLPIGEQGVLQAGRNLRAGEATLARLRLITLVAFIPAMIAAALTGALLTFRAMAPIRRLTVTMREILSKGDLGQRVAPESGRNELNALVELFNRLLARNEALIDTMHNSLDNVAHDFRTPLSRLRNTAERALREDADAEHVREALADCVEESEHLGRLLTTLMDVAEAESGAMRLHLETLSLPDLVESVVELYELVAEDKDIEVETSLPDECMIRADRTRLGQVLANLLDNAIKYSPRSSHVSIAVSEENGRAEIVVRDEGIGINEEDLPHIWERLFRAEPSRTTPGMGLGLSFVKAIIAAHGGEASVESVAGHGATFRITLKVAEDQQA